MSYGYVYELVYVGFCLASLSRSGMQLEISLAALGESVRRSWCSGERTGRTTSVPAVTREVGRRSHQLVYRVCIRLT